MFHIFWFEKRMSCFSSVKKSIICRWSQGKNLVCFETKCSSQPDQMVHPLVPKLYVHSVVLNFLILPFIMYLFIEVPIKILCLLNDESFIMYKPRTRGSEEGSLITFDFMQNSFDHSHFTQNIKSRMSLCFM